MVGIVCVITKTAVYSADPLSYVRASRTAIFILSTHYVRAKGLGSQLSQYLVRPMAVAILLLMPLVALYWAWVGVVVIATFYLVLWYLRYKFIRRIGGVTGDTIGASIEMIELATLFSFVVATFYSV